MKKYTLLFLLFLSICLLPTPIFGDDNRYEATAEHAIAIEVTTGKILYEKDAQTPDSVASITNLLTAYLVFEAVENGKISMDTPVPISDYAYSLTLNTDISNVLLEKRKYTVEELLRASLIVSANSASIALAELVSGSEPAFVNLMREKLESWGITTATVLNASGLNNLYLGDNRYPDSESDGENLFSAQDVATIARRLILDYPQVLRITNQQKFILDGHTYYSGNALLNGGLYQRDGVDGLKTGYSSSAGASLVATTWQQNMRVLTVILNADNSESNPDQRFVATNDLMNYVYQYFRMITFVKAGEPFEKNSISIFNGQNQHSQVVAKTDFKIPIRRAAEQLPSATFQADQNLFEAPVPQGMVVGTLRLKDTDLIGQGYVDEQPSISMVTPKEIPAAPWPLSWWNHFVRYVNEKL